MELLNVALSSIASIIALFILTKIIGNRQLSELNMFDYINGITIGSIAAEMATSLEGDFLLPLLAMVIYACAAVLISYVASKSEKMRRFFTGRSLILLNNNKMYKENFKKAKIDLAEFLTQCRINGFFDLNEVQTAVFETNGRISFMPKAQERPVTPKDLSIPMQAEKPAVTVITDGLVLSGNLHYTGNDMQWLQKQLTSFGISRTEDVFLAMVDGNNKLNAYIKLREKPDRDVFQ